MNNAIEEALKLAQRRYELSKKPPRCPYCNAEQVQLRDWVGDPPEWKCRECHKEFTT